MLLFAVALLGGALLGTLILGVYGYVTYKPNPNCDIFCVASATENAEWDALAGLFLGALVGIALWVLIKAATSHGRWTNYGGWSD
jgi:hypothetical protein